MKLKLYWHFEELSTVLRQLWIPAHSCHYIINSRWSTFMITICLSCSFGNFVRIWSFLVSLVYWIFSQLMLYVVSQNDITHPKMLRLEVYENSLLPTKWPLTKVIETHFGKDGLVRIITIKTSTGKVTLYYQVTINSFALLILIISCFCSVLASGM